MPRPKKLLDTTPVISTDGRKPPKLRPINPDTGKEEKRKYRKRIDISGFDQSVQKLRRVVAETRLRGGVLAAPPDPATGRDLVQTCREAGTLVTFGKDRNLCCYRYRDQEEMGIILVVEMMLPGGSGGANSAASATVLDMVETLESLWMSFDRIHYRSDPASEKQAVGYLSVMKRISEDFFV